MLRAKTTLANPSSKTRAIKIGIWVMLLMVFITGVSLTSGKHQTTTTPYAASTSPLLNGSSLNTTSYAALSPVPSAGDPTSASNGQGPPDANLAKYYYFEGSMGEKIGGGKQDPLNLLPAWRWKGASELYLNVDWKQIPKEVATFLSGAMFSVSAFMWSVILGLLKFALTTDLLNSSALAINQGFYSLFGSLNQSGIFILLGVMALLIGIKKAFKGDTSRIFGMILAVIIPLATTYALASFAGAATTGSNADKMPKGSPAWVASQGTDIVNTVSSGLGSGFGLVGSKPNNSDTALEKDANGTLYNPSCVSYDNALYNQYYNFSSGSSTDRTIESVSYLWQKSYMDNWVMAEGGNSPSAFRMGCMALETNAGTTSDEVSTIAGIAGWNFDKPASNDMFSNGFGSSDNDYESWIFKFAACYWDGKNWNYRAGWGADSVVHGKKASDVCKAWWDTGDGSGVYSWNSASSIKSDTKAADGTDPAGILDVRTTALDFRGNDFGGRMLYGFLGIITAAIYAYVLGGIAIGSIIAQFGFILMMVLLPVTLTMLAIPNGSGERNVAGRKMARMTGGFMAAKASLIVTLTLLIQGVSLFESLASGAIDSMGSTMASLVHGAVPLAALFLMRYLLKTAGVGDITKLSGSVGMSSAAALAASGNAQGQGGWNKQSAEKIANNKMHQKLSSIDRGAKTLAKRQATSIAKATGRKVAAAPAKGYQWADERYGLKVGEKLGNRLGMTDSKQAILGVKGADGKYVGGFAQQLTSLAGVTGLLGETKLGQKALQTKAGQAVTGFANRNVKLADKAAAAQAQRQMRSQLLSGTALKSTAQRIAARDEFVNDIHALTAAHYQAGDKGKVVRNENGELLIEKINPVSGVLEAKPYDSTFTDDQLIQITKEFKDTHGLKANQFIVTRSGSKPQVIPQLSDANNRGRVVECKVEGSTREFAESVLTYLPNEQKIKPKGISDDAYARMLNDLAVAAGGLTLDGGHVQWAKANGVDFSTAAGEEELQKALAGQASKLDAISARVPDDMYRAIVNNARNYDKSMGNTSVLEAGKIVRNQAVIVKADVVQTSQADVLSAAHQFDSIRDNLVKDIGSVLKQGSRAEVEAVKSNVERAIQDNNAALLAAISTTQANSKVLDSYYAIQRAEEEDRGNSDAVAEIVEEIRKHEKVHAAKMGTYEARLLQNEGRLKDALDTNDDRLIATVMDDMAKLTKRMVKESTEVSSRALGQHTNALRQMEIDMANQEANLARVGTLPRQKRLADILPADAKSFW